MQLNWLMALSYTMTNFRKKLSLLIALKYEMLNWKIWKNQAITLRLCQTNQCSIIVKTIFVGISEDKLAINFKQKWTS